MSRLTLLRRSIRHGSKSDSLGDPGQSDLDWQTSDRYQGIEDLVGGKD